VVVPGKCRIMQPPKLPSLEVPPFIYFLSD
jgi:hypothetical protein